MHGIKASLVRVLLGGVTACGCLLAQASAVAQCPEGWVGGNSATDAPYFAHKFTYSYASMSVDVVSIPDPVRSLPAKSWAPTSFPYYPSWAQGSCVSEMAGGRIGAFIQGFFTAQGSQIAGSSQGWPQWGDSGTPPADAAFILRGVYTDGNISQRYDLTVWRVSGQWTQQAPDPPPDPQGGNFGSTPGSTNGKGTLSVTVKKAGNPPAPIAYPYIYIYGPSVGSHTGSSAGQATFSGLSPGDYSVHVICSYTNSTGQTISANQSVKTSVGIGEAHSVEITLDDTGQVSAQTEGSNQTSANSAPSWLASAISYLFVPDQDHVDAIKGSLNQIFQWGPFALISDLVALNQQQAQTMPGIALPVPQLADCGCSWKSTTTQTVPISFTEITSVPAWGVLRSLMGGFVWLGFVGALAWKLMPKQQM